MITIKNIYKYYILCIALLFTITLSQAQEVTVKAMLDTNQFLIGDQIGLELSVKQPVSEFVGIPNIDQQINSELEILDQSENDTTLLETGHYLVKKRVTITAFDSGYFAVPPIPFLYYSDTLRSDTLIFKVNSLPVDTAKAIKDIKMPYEAPLSFAEVYPWVGGGLGLVILILVIIYIIRKIRRNEPIIKRSKPLEPAHIIAYRDLERLKSSKLWQKDKIKEYYTELTDVLRMYLWNRYAIRTLERTSEEILNSLKMSDFKEDEAFNLLKDIFNVSDLVKFAKYQPMANQNELLLDEAFHFVDKTKLIIEEKPEENKEATEGSELTDK